MQSMCNLVNCILGAGVVGYPYCFRSCGLLLSTLLLLLVMVAARCAHAARVARWGEGGGGLLLLSMLLLLIMVAARCDRAAACMRACHAAAAAAVAAHSCGEVPGGGGGGAALECACTCMYGMYGMYVHVWHASVLVYVDAAAAERGVVGRGEGGGA